MALSRPTNIQYLIVDNKAVIDYIIDEVNAINGFPNDKAETYGETMKHPTKNQYALFVNPMFYDNFTTADLVAYGFEELPSDWIVKPLSE